MARDVRELILARMAVIAATIDGVDYSARNELDLSDQRGDSLIIWDGDEPQPPDQVRRDALHKQIVTMLPIVEISLAGKPEDVGQKLNALRMRTLKAFMTDATLLALTLNSRSIAYKQCQTGFSRARQTQASMGLGLAITYALKPSDF